MSGQRFPKHILFSYLLANHFRSALIFGVASFDMKYIAFSTPDSWKGGDEALLGELVHHSSEYAKKRGADQVVALFTGARADAEKKWSRYGFKFMGVGPAPEFCIRMSLGV